MMAMELPPGWRGYGAKDYIDHPDTAARAAEVDAAQGSRSADRFERAARADAVRAPAAGAAARPQRAHRRAAARRALDGA